MRRTSSLVSLGVALDRELDSDFDDILKVAAIDAEIVVVADNIDDVTLVGEDLIKGIGTNQPTDSAILNALTNASLAASYADQTALDVAATNADVVLTHADVVSTNADVILTNADVVSTGLDVVSTNANALSTAQDAIDTAADLTQTNQDTLDTAADLLLTNADVVSTSADVVLTNADVALTGLDVLAADASAIAAGISEVNAAASAAEAEISADLVTGFTETYFGPLAVAPTIGSHQALTIGDMYFDTSLTVPMFKVYRATGWSLPANSTMNKESIIATEGQTAFVVPNGYTSGYLEVMHNGITLDDSDFIATDDVNVTLTGIVPNLNDIIAFKKYDSFIASGGGDMLASTYDITSNGVVDNSELVNGLTVETAVPAGAVFTDTTYPDVTATTGGVLTDAQAVKFDGIEAAATADQTGSEIKVLYEAEADTNVYTDAEKTKLSTVEQRANHTGTQDLSTITYPSTVGSPVGIDGMNELFNHIQSSGIMNGCALTDNLDGTINIASGNGMLRAVADEHTTLYTVEIPAQVNLTMLEGVNYVSITWNAGSPIFTTSSSESSFNCLDTCVAYIVVREGTALSWINAKEQNVDSNRKARRLFLQFSRFIHLGGGSMLGDASALAVNVTAGAFNFMLEEIPHDAFDTSIVGTANVNVFEMYYRDGVGGFTDVYDQKVVNTTLYDDGTGTLATIPNSKFGVTWFYLALNNPSHLIAMVGQGVYASQAEADAASPPAEVPAIIEGLGVLIGYVTFQESDTEFTHVLSSFSLSLTASQAVNHNGLSGIQGGAADDYYHITTTEKTNYDTAYTHSQAAHAPTDADNTSNNETSHADVVVDADIGVNVQGYTTVLAATTASFLIADETKLDGIEASANNYVHPTGSGNYHITDDGTNVGKVLTASAVGGTFTWSTVAGGGDLLSTNNLSDVASAATSRTNLGLAIGTDVQAYDVDTAKTDVTQTFTTGQNGTDVTDNDGNFDLSAAGTDYKCTPVATFVLTFTNIPTAPAVRKGEVILYNPSGYVVTKATTVKASSTFLDTVSAAGTYRISYRTDGTNVYVSNSGALS